MSNSNSLVTRNLYSKKVQEVKNNHPVVFDCLLNPALFDAIREEVFWLESRGSRKDFESSFAGTPRHLTLVNGSKIVESARLIHQWATHYETFQLMKYYASRQLYISGNKDEFLLVNISEGKNDSLGWHIDDPDWVLVLCVEAPDESVGGYVEYIDVDWELYLRLAKMPTHDNLTKEQLEKAIDYANQEGLIKRIVLKPGQGYLLNSGRHLHRVAPLTEDGYRRVSVVIAYDEEEHKPYHDEVNSYVAD